MLNSPQRHSARLAQASGSSTTERLATSASQSSQSGEARIEQVWRALFDQPPGDFREPLRSAPFEVRPAHYRGCRGHAKGAGRDPALEITHQAIAGIADGRMPAPAGDQARRLFLVRLLQRLQQHRLPPRHEIGAVVELDRQHVCRCRRRDTPRAGHESVARARQQRSRHRRSARMLRRRPRARWRSRHSPAADRAGAACPRAESSRPSRRLPRARARAWKHRCRGASAVAPRAPSRSGPRHRPASRSDRASRNRRRWPRPRRYRARRSTAMSAMSVAPGTMRGPGKRQLVPFAVVADHRTPDGAAGPRVSPVPRPRLR